MQKRSLSSSETNVAALDWNSIFITGMLRSGTTLFDKLLNRHPLLNVVSQPFFSLYSITKAAYNDAFGFRGLPLTPKFMERHNPNTPSFDQWLRSSYIQDGLLRAIEEGSTTAKGQGTPLLRGRALRLHPGSFFSIWKQLHAHVLDSYGAPGRGGYMGSKEVLCEEFVPYLADHGSKCFIIVRDPRAVVASLNSGEYQRRVGDTYPILLNVRNWRKSVAYALWAKKQRNILCVRYEDVVCDCGSVLDRVASHLGISDFSTDWYVDGIEDQDGTKWKGNSSFSEMEFIDSASMDKWRNILDPGIIRLIESCTYPELLALGYIPDSNMWTPLEASNYVEDLAKTRAEYSKIYGFTSANIDAELARYNHLMSPSSLNHTLCQELFIFEEAYLALKDAIAHMPR